MIGINPSKYQIIVFQAESPSAGGFTAIGFYLLTSLFFLTAAFIESIYIISLHHANKSRYEYLKHIYV